MPARFLSIWRILPEMVLIVLVRWTFFDGLDTGRRKLPADASEFRRKLARGEDQVHMIEGDRIARHTAVLRRFRALHERNAAFALDGFRAGCAVGIRA